MKINLWFILLSSSLSFASQWEIDSSHASAHFKIRHMTVSNVSGEITGMAGSFKIDDKDNGKMSLEGTLDMNTINTSNTKRDEHLKANDFFDVKKFPKAAFKTKAITSLGGDKVTLIGELTMKGVTKEIAITGELTPAIKDPFGKVRRGLSGTLKIERKDFGIVWNKVLDNGGLALGDTVDVTFEIELTETEKNKKG